MDTKNVHVVINAGGKGTRLYPLTKDVPKPLVKVGDLTMIEHIIKQFQACGFTKFHIIANWMKDKMVDFFNEHPEYDVTIYNEETPLGTGGGIYLLKQNVKDTFILNNCDTLCLVDFEDMYRKHKESGNTITCLTTQEQQKYAYGVFEAEGDKIVSIKEKPTHNYMVNVGTYICEPNVITDIKENTEYGFTDIIELEMNMGNRIGSYHIEKYCWLDMGNHQALLDSERILKYNQFQKIWK